MDHAKYELWRLEEVNYQICQGIKRCDLGNIGERRQDYLNEESLLRD